MKSIFISGGIPLLGEVKISGAKNAAVAILPASILSDSPCRIENIPDISDMSLMYDLLEKLNVKIRFINKSCLEIDPTCITSCCSSFESARSMRASCYLLGSLLGKFGYAKIPIPGGCNFGTRPIDQHIKGFKALGATCVIDEDFIEVKSCKLIGSNIYFDIVSVGATINVILAAIKADGVTVLENAAKEPHVVDIANFLNNMGADIMGAGTDVIKIKGVKKLNGVNYSIIPDQIESGTFMACAFSSLGDITLKNVIPKHLESIIAKFEEMGSAIKCYDDSVNIKCFGKPKNCNVKTMPYPGFPTDMQPQITAVLTKSNGVSFVNESVWYDRFRYISELKKFGALISINENVATIEGVSDLNGANVRACDLRAGAAMVVAGVGAIGNTEIKNIEYIYRGYEDIVNKLSLIGAKVSYKNYEEIGNEVISGVV